MEALLAIRPNEAVIDPGASVFGLSAFQIYRRIKVATKMAGFGEGFTAHSPKVGVAQDLSAAGRSCRNSRPRAGGTAPPCRPSTPRPRLPTGVPWHGTTGVTHENDHQYMHTQPLLRGGRPAQVRNHCRRLVQLEKLPATYCCRWHPLAGIDGQLAVVRQAADRVP